MGILAYTENFNLAKYESGSDDWGGGINNNFDLIDSYLSSAILQSSPIGTILMYSSENTPDGWLFCNGSSLLKTEYSVLFNIIGTRFGSVDESHFNLPDMRGMFARGLDNGAGNDPDASSRIVSNTGGSNGDAVGSKQIDCFQGHYPGDGYATSLEAASKTGTNVMIPASAGWTTQTLVSSADRQAMITDGVNGTPRTSSETRPKNVALAFIIKF